MTLYTYMSDRWDVCSLTAQFIKTKIQTVSNTAFIPLFSQESHTVHRYLLKYPPLPRFQPVLRRRCFDYEVFFLQTAAITPAPVAPAPRLTPAEVDAATAPVAAAD